MKTRLEQIIAGETDICRETVRKYRDLAAKRGMVIPEIDWRKVPEGKCGKRIESGPPKERPDGVGSWLERFFGWLLVKPEDDECQCKDLARKLDFAGPEWCRRPRHRKWIVLKIDSHAKGRRLLVRRLTCCCAFRFAIDCLLELAIRSVERRQ